jgi:hypothetical protein
MVGIGAIFEAYRSGEFEDDDEVAVVHASGEDGFRALSSAMATLRFGLARAVASSIISDRSRQTLIRSAKARFYQERSWKALLADGRNAAVDAVELGKLEKWLRDEDPNQKRDDAIALLERMASDIDAGRGAFKPAFSFEPTVFWDRAERALREKTKR